jgi:uncharacterized cupredoxin-like copper-binding protein
MDGLAQPQIGRNLLRHSVLRTASAAVAALAISAFAVPVLAQAKAHAATTTISVTAVDFKFTLSAQSISKPGTVVFKIVNKGHVQHDFRIDSETSKLLSPGKSTTLTVDLKKKGSYYYDCTVPGHAALGMKGYFKVT